MRLLSRHANLGITNKALAPLVARLIKAGTRFSATTLLEITAWVLLTAWWLALAVWLWVNFSPWGTLQ
jgi:hypothetical protein